MSLLIYFFIFILIGKHLLIRKISFDLINALQKYLLTPTNEGLILKNHKGCAKCMENLGYVH